MVNIDRVRSLIKEKGLKIGYVQSQLGVRRTYFAEVKAGKDVMSDERIYQLASILGTTYDYLTGRTDYQGDKVERIERFSPERFDEQRIKRHLLDNWIEERLPVPYGYLELVRNNKVYPSQEVVAKLAILLNTTYDYLMGITDDPQVPLNDRAGVKIKVFGEVAAGIPIAQIDNFDPADPASWEEIDRGTARNGSYFGLRLKGDSMEPRMYSGDVVIVRQQASVDSGDIAVVAINGDTATCKKVVYDENGGMFLVSLNSKYPPKYFNRDQILSFPVTIMGKVVELRSKF